MFPSLVISETIKAIIAIRKTKLCMQKGLQNMTPKCAKKENIHYQQPFINSEIKQWTYDDFKERRSVIYLKTSFFHLLLPSAAWNKDFEISHLSRWGQWKECSLRFLNHFKFFKSYQTFREYLICVDWTYLRGPFISTKLPLYSKLTVEQSLGIYSPCQVSRNPTYSPCQAFS